MQEINWLQIVVAVLGGGAAGAVITAIVTSYRARRQPVGHRIDVVPVFRPSGQATQIEAMILVKHGDKSVTFKNLFLADVQIINKGNRDLDELRFGATLNEGDQCIFVESKAPDRHHVAELVNAVTPDAPQSAVDFTVRPFNRGDLYSFKLYLVIPQDRQDPRGISLGSASSVQFVAMPTVSELMVVAASGVTVNAGPLLIGLTRRK